MKKNMDQLFIIKNVHMKFQNPSSHCSKVNRRTHTHTHTQTSRKQYICPSNFFKVGGIMNFKHFQHNFILMSITFYFALYNKIGIIRYFKIKYKIILHIFSRKYKFLQVCIPAFECFSYRRIKIFFPQETAV